MTRINVGKVILGGLVAGIVMNIIDFATGYLILMNDMKATMERLHLNAASMDTMAGWIPWILVDMLSGLILVFAYAAMRPRFGPGVRTALVSSFTLYLAVTVVLYGFMSMGIFTPDVYVKSSLCALVSVLVSGVAGAALYTE